VVDRRPSESTNPRVGRGQHGLESIWRSGRVDPHHAACRTTAFINQVLPINSDQTAAREAVRGPAIFILVLSVLNIITSVVSCFWLAYESQFMTALGLPEQTNQIQTNMKIFFSVPATVIGFFLAVACLIGSLRMMKLQSHNFAIATAIMMLIPCSNCCCFLNIGAGIWALVVLQKPEVKSSFE